MFQDPLARTVPDHRYVHSEERGQTIGSVEGIVVIVVAHTVKEREGEELYRIISARKATPSERTKYEETL